MSQGTKYEYQRRLGGGGMAEVFLASTVGVEGFTRPVAIKRVLPSFSEDPSFATMFVNEARLSSILRHPNIVQVLDFDRDGEARLFLVMELVEGKDLSDLAETGPLPIPVVVHVIGEVLKGLAHAHEMTTTEGRPLGIVHRDISPHNVLVSWDGAVKVSDFGIAKAMLASGAGRSGMIKGKPLYMAPEQVISPDDLDHRADLFAVGVMLFELLTGQRIYKGNTQEEVLTDVIQVAKGWRQLTAPTSLRPELPWDLAQVVMMLLAPDRQHRFASARDALDALLHCASASARGGELLAQLMFERFPNDAPKRVARRSSGGVIASADAPRWESAPAAMAAGTPHTPSVQAQMGAETRTFSPAPGPAMPGTFPPAAVTPGGTAETRPLGPAATGPAGSVVGEPAPRRSRAPLIAGVAAIAAVIVVAIVMLALRGGRDTPSNAASIAAESLDARAPGPDASIIATARVEPDAGVTVPAPVDASPAAPDAAVVDAGPATKRRPTHRRTQTSEPPANVSPTETGTIVATSGTPVDVYIDGKFVGGSPVRELTAVGPHKVKFLSPDGRSTTTTVKVKKDSESRVSPAW